MAIPTYTTTVLCDSESLHWSSVLHYTMYRYSSASASFESEINLLASFQGQNCMYMYDDNTDFHLYNGEREQFTF